MLDHGSNSGKQFVKWPPETILRNICQYILHQLANLNDQNVQYEFFQGAESIRRGFEMTWNKDHEKFIMAAILLHQILFLFTSWFIIDTGSPWAKIGPRAPPLLSMRGTILIMGLLWMLLTMLPE